MATVVACHRSHPPNKRCIDSAAVCETAHFFSGTFGVCSVVSIVILTAPSQGFGLAGELGILSVLFHPVVLYLWLMCFKIHQASLLFFG